MSKGQLLATRKTIWMAMPLEAMCAVAFQLITKQALKNILGQDLYTNEKC